MMKINKKYVIGISIVIVAAVISGGIYFTYKESQQVTFNEYTIPTYSNEGEYLKYGYAHPEEYSTPAGLSKIENLYYGLPLFTDGEKVFLRDKEIPVELTGLEAIGENLIKDTKGVFYVDYDTVTKIEGLNPKGLRSISSTLLANDTQVYIGTYLGYVKGELLSVVANPSKLRNVPYNDEGEQGILTDDSKFYFATYRHLFELPVKNPKLLEKSFYIKGTDKVYYGGQVISEADPATFVLTEDSQSRNQEDYNSILYAKDKNNVYYKGKKLIGADPSTFVALPSSFYQEYGRDSSRVYWNGEVVKGADPTSFTVLKYQPYEGCGNGEYAKDATSVYYKTEKLIGADPATFKTYIYGYAGDALKSFFEGIEILLPSAELEKLECNYG